MPQSIFQTLKQKNIQQTMESLAQLRKGGGGNEYSTLTNRDKHSKIWNFLHSKRRRNKRKEVKYRGDLYKGSLPLIEMNLLRA